MPIEWMVQNICLPWAYPTHVRVILPFVCHPLVIFLRVSFSPLFHICVYPDSRCISPTLPNFVLTLTPDAYFPHHPMLDISLLLCVFVLPECILPRWVHILRIRELAKSQLSRQWDSRRKALPPLRRQCIPSLRIYRYIPRVRLQS